MSYGCHHQLEDLLLQLRGPNELKFCPSCPSCPSFQRNLKNHFAPLHDCNLHYHSCECRITFPHHLPVRHLSQTPGSHHQCLSSVAENGFIRVHFILSSSDPQLNRTTPFNLMINLPQASLIKATKGFSLFTYVLSIQAFLRNLPKTLPFQSVFLDPTSNQDVRCNFSAAKIPSKRLATFNFVIQLLN